MTLVCEWYSGTYLTWHIQYLFFEGKWQKLRLVIDRPSFSGKITVTGGILGSNCSLCFLHQFQADLTLAHHKQIWKLRNQTLPISTPKISWFRVVTVGPWPGLDSKVLPWIWWSPMTCRAWKRCHGCHSRHVDDWMWTTTHNHPKNMVLLIGFEDLWSWFSGIDVC